MLYITTVKCAVTPTHTQLCTLTINLQPIAQLDGVAMANILPSESSAVIGAREAESHFQHVMCCYGSGGERGRKGGSRRKEKRMGGARCILIRALRNMWLPCLQEIRILTR